MIRQYIGRLGQGKTLLMIFDAWPYLTDTSGKYKIVTNQPINIKVGKKTFNFPPLSDEELIDSFFNDVNTLYLLDEAHLIFPAYKTSSISQDLQARLSYMRKYGNAILYTSQGYNHIHKRLRDITNEVCKVRKTKFHPLWGHVGTYFDPEAFDMSFSTKTEEQIEKMVIYRRHVWRWKLKKIYKSYDTLYTSTTTIEGDEVTREFKQPTEMGVKPGLYNAI